VLLIEKAAVRTSTEATFVLATIVPSNQIPGRIVNVENHIRTIRGGAFGFAVGAGGSSTGVRAWTIRLTGMGPGFPEHAASSVKAATDAKAMMRRARAGNAKHEDAKRKEAIMEQEPLIPVEFRPSETGQAYSKRPRQSTAVDWLITLAAVWIMTGLFIDAHQHLFLAVESFINPWHLTLYSGAVFAAAVLSVTIAYNYRRAGGFWKAIPFGYVQSVLGVAALLIGGALDAVWHSIFGFEHQLDLLLSPPHLFLLTGLFFLITGPVRSGLARAEAKNLLDQLPMLVSLGLAFEIAQFVTQYGFYPEALMGDHPLSQLEFHNEQFVLSVFLFYRQALEIAIIIWQSVLLAACALYLCVYKRLHFGAIAIVCLVEKLWIGGELSRDLMEFVLVALASLIAGVLGDIIVAKLRPSARNPNAFRLLAFVVPSAYFGAYFALAVPMFGGTWWDASFVFGAIAEGGLVGLCISQLYLAGTRGQSASIGR
jgi:hypothetical protein